MQSSDARRANAGPPSQAHADELPAERIAELRRRVLEGAYDSVQLAGQLAQRMLQRGDV